MPRHKAEIFLTGIVSSPQPQILQDTSRDRLPFYLSSGTEGSHSDSARMAPAPGGSQAVTNVVPGDICGSPGFLVLCFEGHKSKGFIKRQLLSQVHFVYLVKPT